ncbi:hypothetical protein KIH24_08675 [Rhizobiales bacterium TNE-4]|nr:hypothetical protein [Rhizobiales bacterium TNE-4]MBV1827697.1 hypothetical protein [Rhizobiales bacterium TNE-4]
MRKKIVVERDGFHHLVFVGLRAKSALVFAEDIARLQNKITTIVEESHHVRACAFFGNEARIEDDLQFGFHAIFDTENGLDSVRARADHIALMDWFDRVSNGRRVEINAVVENGQRRGSNRIPGRGLLTRP